MADISGQRPTAVNGLLQRGSKGQRTPSPPSRGSQRALYAPPKRLPILDSLGP